MKLAAIIAGLAIGATSGASAEIVVITYTGTVTFGLDNMGLFGTAGASLVGDPYTAVYTVNTADGITETSPTASIVANNGGVPPVSEVLTIGGRSVDLTDPLTNNEDVAERAYGYTFPSSHPWGLSGPVVYGALAGLQGPDDLSTGNGIVSNNAITSSPDYWQPMSYSIKPGDVSVGGFQECTSNSAVTCDGLTLYSATVNVVDIPEPAVWALMLGGIGAVGAALRMQQRRIGRIA